MLDLEAMFHKLVQLVHVYICEKLARKVPDRYALASEEPALAGSETLDNFAQEPHNVLVLDPLAKHTKQNSMIHAVEKLLNVAFQNKARARAVPRDFSRGPLKRVDSFMGAVADSAGKRSRNERLLEDRVDDEEDRMMQYPVAHERFMNMPLLRIFNVEALVGAVSVVLGDQLAMKREEVGLKFPFEFLDVGLVSLVGFECVPCREEILGRGDPFENISIHFHG